MDASKNSQNGFFATEGKLLGAFKVAGYLVGGPLSVALEHPAKRSWTKFGVSTVLCAAFWGTAIYEFDPNSERRIERVISLAEKTPCTPAAVNKVEPALGQACEPILMPEYTSPIFRLKTPAWNIHVIQGSYNRTSSNEECRIRTANITSTNPDSGNLVFGSYRLQDHCRSINSPR